MVQNMKLTKKWIAVAATAGCLAGVESVQAQAGNSAFFRLLSEFAGNQESRRFDGAVYAMANGFAANTVVAYGRRSDGTLSLIGSTASGGRGGAFDGGEGLDPLISAYAIENTADRRYVLAVNAGSNTLSVFRVNRDFSLTRTDEAFTFGVGPNSIAIRGNRVFVTNIDADGQFQGEPDQEGSLMGFQLTRGGRLIPLVRTFRLLGNRPSAVRFSPDGRSLVVASINAGSAALASGSTDELVLYGFDRYGSLSLHPVSTGASTLPGNEEGRNLPSAIGFEIVEEAGRQFVVVTEAREFRPDGTPPVFDGLQTGSVSTWEIDSNHQLIPIDQDVLAGNSFVDGERTACWIAFSENQDYFWVSNALDASLSTYSFSEGRVAVREQVSVRGIGPEEGNPFGTTDGWIDLDTSRDGRYVYQLYGLSGTIGVFAVGQNGTLSVVETVTDILPQANTQGIIAF